MPVLHDYKPLLNPEKLWTCSDVLEGVVDVPKQRGLYAWYFRDLLPDTVVKDAHEYRGLHLLYVGIAPRNLMSKGNLRERLKKHLKGGASESTLRQTLGCVLSKRLGLKLQVSSNRLTFGQGEQRLSEWMQSHAFVVWMEHPEPWIAESGLVQSLSVPLNLRHNKHHPYYATLSAMRRGARKFARS